MNYLGYMVTVTERNAKPKPGRKIRNRISGITQAARELDVTRVHLSYVLHGDGYDLKHRWL